MQVSGKNIVGKLSFVTLFVMLMAKSAWAQDLGVINNVSGNVFIYSKEKLTKLKIGDSYSEADEIITEEGAQVTFSDFYDHKFHLSGSGHLKLWKKWSQLIKGHIWIQSFHKKEVFVMKTANAQMFYPSGEGIFSFDQESGKTQLLVVNGTFTLNNLLQDHFTERVASGQFSFVDDHYNDGRPRKGTSIGEHSFHKITSLFRGIVPLLKQNIPVRKNKTMNSQSRKIASVENASMRVKRGDKFNLNKFYAKKLQRVKLVGKTKRRQRKPLPSSRVKMRIFGRGKPTQAQFSQREKSNRRKPASRSRGNRAPASIPIAAAKGRKSPSAQDGFENSLKTEYSEQTRHPSELNKLIKDLKSYNQDYNIAY